MGITRRYLQIYVYTQFYIKIYINIVCYLDSFVTL